MSKKTGRYRKIDLRIHADEKYRRLSDPQPCGKVMWFHLIAGKQTGIIPGLCSIGEAAFAEQLRWPLKGFREAFREVFREGMAEADWEAQFVYVPNAIEYNAPASPNVVTSWHDAWNELPECPLKLKAWQALKDFLEDFGEAFGKAFREACPKPFGKPLANQEQEQEQEQEQNQEQKKDVSPVVADRADGIPILTFACSGEPQWWILTQSQIDEWIPLYPGIDILAECRKAKAWNDTQAAKKTAKGMTKFLVNWFNRATNTTPTRTQPTQFKTKRELDNEFMAKQMADAFNHGGQT